MMSMMEKIKSFLPSMYKDDNLAQSILSAVENYTEEVKCYMKYIFEQFSATSASEEGIEEWEKELAITPAAGSDLELRRAVVRSKLMRPPTMTPERLLAIINCFTINKDAEFRKVEAPYTIGIKFPTMGIMNWDSLMEALGEAKPAHLMLDMQLEKKKTLKTYIGLGLTQSGAQTIKTALPTKAIMKQSVRGAVVAFGQKVIRTKLDTEFKTELKAGSLICMSGHITIGVREGELDWLNGQAQS